jgi:hypothetical protein
MGDHLCGTPAKLKKKYSNLPVQDQAAHHKSVSSLLGRTESKTMFLLVLVRYEFQIEIRR